MKITVLGAGSAFSMKQYQSNFLIEFDGYRMLFDAGGDIRWSMQEIGLGVNDIDGIYISHLHADHIGGLEWISLNRFFNKNIPKPDLYISEYLVDDLWADCLKGGLSTYQGAVLELKDYFNLRVIKENDSDSLFGIKILNGKPFMNYNSDKRLKMIPVQTVHVMSGYKIMPSFGLMLQKEIRISTPIEGGIRGDWVPTGKKVYITADTQYSPYQIRDFYAQADLILEDCETATFKSHVHAHYEDLKTLPDEFKSKMWLYHYNDNILDEKNYGDMQVKAKGDGFLGFLRQGQVIDI